MEDEFALDALGNHVRVGDYVVHPWRLRHSKWYRGKMLMMHSEVVKVYSDQTRIRVALYPSLIAFDKENSPDTSIIKNFVKYNDHCFDEHIRNRISSSG